MMLPVLLCSCKYLQHQTIMYEMITEEKNLTGRSLNGLKPEQKKYT